MVSIHVAYAEDHVLLRNTVCGLLQEKGLTVSAFANGKEMIAYLQNSHALPDICIVNVHLPFVDGFEITRRLRKQYAAVKVLVYSASSYDADIIKMLSYGAHGYLVKNGDIEELYKAIVAVHEKGIYIDDTVGKVVFKYLRRVGF